MSINGVSGYSALRFGGLATGLDTDSIIKQLMEAERIPLVKLQQKKTILEWKRDNYRDMTNLLRGIRDDFMDVLKPSSNMRSASSYKKFTVSSDDTSVVTATASSTAVPGTHTIDSVTKLAEAATADQILPAGTVTSDLAGSAAAAVDYTGANNFQVTLNGVTKTITLRNGAYASAADLVGNGVDGIQTLVNNAFGAGKITVTEAADAVKFEAAGSKVTLSSGTSNDALANLRFTSGASNRLNTSDTLENITLKNGPLVFDGSDDLTFSINGESFAFDKTTTLSSMLSQINSSDAGVTITYSELTDQFSITAKEKGAGDNIILANTGVGNFFGAASNINAGTYSNGQDAEFILDGVTTTRNDNTFSIDGVTYTLKSTFDDPDTVAKVTLTVGQDVDGIYNNIKNFVDKYNEVIGKINNELSEKYDRNYLPLSDEQKKEMSEDDIKAWEDKAKTGLLRSDSILSKVVTDMRKAMFDGITGVSGDLSQIGINTSTNYLDKGKLIIDETELKEAIRTNPDLVQNLFQKESTSQPSYSPNLTSAQRTDRYNEEGIVHRLYDIIQDNIRTTRNTSGQKGTLLEKAGLVGDISEFNNLIDKDIDRYEIDIDELNEKLIKKETRYYTTFTALEKAISQMNSQSSWLSQQFGG